MTEPSSLPEEETSLLLAETERETERETDDALSSSHNRDEDGEGEVENEEALTLTEAELALLSQQSSVTQDLKTAVLGARWGALFTALLALLLSYQLTVAPYRAHITHTDTLTGTHLDTHTRTLTEREQELRRLRPVLTGEEQERMQRTLLFAETSFLLSLSNNNDNNNNNNKNNNNDHSDVLNVSVRFQQQTNKHGHHRLPRMFYEGVTFGVGCENPHGLEYTAYNTLSQMQLYEDLQHLRTRPTQILSRTASLVRNDSAPFFEQGYAVHFSFASLSEQGMLSSDLLQPWKRVLPEILSIARKYRQTYVTVWYPHQFGGTRRRTSESPEALFERDSAVVPVPLTGATVTEKEMQSERGTHTPTHAPTHTADDDDVDEASVTVHSTHRWLRETQEQFRHINVLQAVVPTRTGLHGLQSSGAVWLSAVNGSQPFAQRHMMGKDW